jgi:hypothetical protein
MKKMLAALAACCLALTACDEGHPPVRVVYPEDAGTVLEDGGTLPACEPQVIYVYVTVEPDAGPVLVCPPQPVCESPDAGSPDAGEGPDCEHGRKVGNPHCD